MATNYKKMIEEIQKEAYEQLGAIEKLKVSTELELDLIASEVQKLSGLKEIAKDAGNLEDFKAAAKDLESAQRNQNDMREFLQGLEAKAAKISQKMVEDLLPLLTEVRAEVETEVKTMRADIIAKYSSMLEDIEEMKEAGREFEVYAQGIGLPSPFQMDVHVNEITYFIKQNQIRKV